MGAFRVGSLLEGRSGAAIIYMTPQQILTTAHGRAKKTAVSRTRCDIFRENLPKKPRPRLRRFLPSSVNVFLSSSIQITGYKARESCIIHRHLFEESMREIEQMRIRQCLFSIARKTGGGLVD